MAKKFTAAVQLKGEDKASTKFSRAFSRIGKGAKHAGTVAKSAFKGLALGAGVAGGAVAALGFGIWKVTKSYATEADEIGKFARQVGVGVEAIQELDFASKRAGVGPGVLRKSIEKFNKTVGEAKAGTGTLITGLGKADPAFLTVLKSANSTGEALDLALGYMSKIEDPTKRAAVAAWMFGRAGGQLQRMAEGGAEGLSKLREEARRYGVITEEQTKAAEEYVDRLADMEQAFRGLKITMGGELMPLARDMVTRLTGWIVENKGQVAKIVRDFAAGAIDNMRAFLDYVEKSRPAIERFARDAADAVGMVAGSLRDMAEAFRLVKGYWQEDGGQSKTDDQDAERRMKLEAYRGIKPGPAIVRAVAGEPAAIATDIIVDGLLDYITGPKKGKPGPAPLPLPGPAVSEETNFANRPSSEQFETAQPLEEQKSRFEISIEPTADFVAKLRRAVTPESGPDVVFETGTASPVWRGGL